MTPKLSSPLFTVLGFTTRQLGLEDVGLLQALLVRCSDYFHLVSNSPPPPSAASSLLTEHPDGKNLEDKSLLGFFSDSRDLIGVLDFVRDYPSRGDWWLGLLLLDPAFRNGLGFCIYRAYETWAIQCKVHRINLGVIDQNQGAYRFWRKIGFEPLERQPARLIGNAGHVVITMCQTLTQ
jgi:RimJ/RimL family protein N-acetyltransferase